MCTTYWKGVKLIYIFLLIYSQVYSNSDHDVDWWYIHVYCILCQSVQYRQTHYSFIHVTGYTRRFCRKVRKIIVNLIEIYNLVNSIKLKMNELDIYLRQFKSLSKMFNSCNIIKKWLRISIFIQVFWKFIRE